MLRPTDVTISLRSDADVVQHPRVVPVEIVELPASSAEARVLPIAPVWRRVLAHVIDSYTLALLLAPFSWSQSLTPDVIVAMYLCEQALRSAYDPVLHAWRGQTFGKRLVGIELRTVSGDMIGWRHALQRSSVDLAATVLYVALLLSAWDTDALVQEAQHGAGIGKVDFAGRTALIWIGSIWIWSELITMLARNDRRALHDLLAGTKVVCSPE